MNTTKEKWGVFTKPVVAQSVIKGKESFKVFCGSCSYPWTKKGKQDDILPARCPYCWAVNVNGKMKAKNVLEEVA